MSAAMDAIEKVLRRQFKDAKHRHLHGAEIDPEKYQHILQTRRARIEKDKRQQRVKVVQLWATESTGFESESVHKDNSWLQSRWNING